MSDKDVLSTPNVSMSVNDEGKSTLNNSVANTFTADNDGLQTPMMGDPQTEIPLIDESNWKEFQPDVWRNQMNSRLGNVTAAFRNELTKIKNQNRE